MAIRVATAVTDDDGVLKITWAGLLDNDTGAPVRVGRYADKTAQVIQVAAGSADTVALQGSQDGGTTWGDLHDPQGDLFDASGNFNGAATINDPVVISESPLELRPIITAGDSATNITVIVTMPTRGK